MEKVWPYVIIGSGVAGSAALEELVKGGADEVLMLTKDTSLPYDRPPLTKKFLRGESTVDEIRYHPAAWYGTSGATVLLREPVASITPASSTLLLESGEEVGYGSLLFAPGVQARHLSIPGSDAENVVTVRTLEEAMRLKDQLVPGKNVVIIGAGFVGMEVAAAANLHGCTVSVIHNGPFLWNRFAPKEVATFFEGEYRKRGVAFFFDDEPIAFLGDKRAYAVVTKSGRTIQADIVVVGIGTVLPEAFLKKTSVASSQGVAVDARLRTTAKNIFAAGDIAQFSDPIFGGTRRVEHWGHADYTGRLAARNMRGAEESYDLLTYVFSDLFDLHIEFAGNEAGYDAVEMLGEMKSRQWTALYKKAGKVQAFFQVNGSEDERSILEKRIREEQQK